VLALRPKRVADIEEYAKWLGDLSEGLSNRTRILAPWLRSSAAPERRRVVSQKAALEMPEALEQLAASGGGLDSPGGQFRLGFVRLNNALTAGDLKGAEHLGNALVKIAWESGWFHLTAPVNLALGAALLAEGRVQTALRRYRDVEAAALKGIADGVPLVADACASLRTQARLCMGSAHLSAGHFDQAERCFAEVAARAEANADALLALDGWRLASFCHEQMGHRHEARQCALRGLELAEQRLTREERLASALPHLGEALSRLTPRVERPEVERRISRLMESPGREPIPSSLRNEAV